jgi:hypothetical protein
VQEAVFIQKYQLLNLILVRFGLFVKVFLVFLCGIFVISSGNVSSIEQSLIAFSRGRFTVKLSSEVRSRKIWESRFEAECDEKRRSFD